MPPPPPRPGSPPRSRSFDTDYTWTVTATTPNGAQADADQIVTDSGLVTVTGVDPGTAASVTVQAEIPGQTLPATGTTTGTSLQTAHNPEFGDAVRKANGFEVPIRNFAANDDFTWAIEDVTPGANADLDQDTGLVTVTDVAPGAEASVTVTATQQGVFVQGRNSKTASALNGARTRSSGARLAPPTASRSRSATTATSSLGPVRPPNRAPSPSTVPAG